uniref:Uncharacterized protein n=1 Tax=Aquilaria malaccensis TaxID=223753 RepID=A0A4Y6GLG3_9ROSI|nr:hypothetical protein [Aquilaria malaccensis]
MFFCITSMIKLIPTRTLVINLYQKTISGKSASLNKH